MNTNEYTIPLPALNQHVAILGKTGSGKTFAAKGLVELLATDGRQICVLDPTGAWWGLRVSKDGKGRGFDFLLLGGSHADIPLSPHSGAAVAQLVTGQRVSVVIDTSGFTVGEYTRWFIDFAGTLYSSIKSPLHLIIDEAHHFMPQGKSPDVDAGKMLHAGNRLMSGGRSRGIRGMLITQRPAKLHKDSLTCADTLIAMRVLAPQDRKAVKDWVDGAGSGDDPKEVLNSLAQLPKGEGWVWYPEGGFLKRIKFPAIRTYDSSKTPEHGESDLPKVAEINLEAVKAAMSAAVEEAKANDPKQLRARIADLEALLKVKPSVDKATGTSMLSARLEEMTKQRDETEKRIQQLVDANAAHEDRRRTLVTALKTIGDYAKAALDGTGMFAPLIPMPTKPPVTNKPQEGADVVAKVHRDNGTTKAAAAAKVEGSATLQPNPDPSGPQRKLLEAVKWWNSMGISCATRVQVAHVAGYTPSSGTWRNLMSECKTRGWISLDDDCIHLASDLMSGVTPVPPSTSELHSRVCEKLSGPQRKLLSLLLDQRGRELARSNAAELCGYEASGGTWRNLCSELKSLSLITYPKKTTIAAAAWLFPGGWS